VATRPFQPGDFPGGQPVPAEEASRPSPEGPVLSWNSRLASLEERAQTLREELRQAEAEIKAHLADPPPVASTVTFSADDKIRLFRSLFVGRDDVFARRWENDTGKTGYAPACGNEWVWGICQKPRVKCALCPHQAFTRLGENILKDHLQGRSVVGVYPLDTFGHTIFLAADFDGEHWSRDIRAMIRAARELGVPFAVERSRSGDGAHLWVFFEEPVSAARARRLGFLLLSSAMEHEHRLPLQSYDRLFPNQDVLPDGGFGNLIALPLQRKAREKGNTLFLDDDLQVIADPWGFLATLPRVSATQLDSWTLSLETSPATRGAEDDPEEDPPWLRPPSRSKTPGPIKGLPASLKVVRGQALFLERSGLPSPLLARCKRLAIIPNPEFHRREAMRLSVSGTPRLVRCFEEDDRYLSLPRGCEVEFEQLAGELGIGLEWEDQLVEGEGLDVTFQGELRPEQVEAVAELERHRLGILSAPPGAGKTVMAAALLARLQRSTLILVHRQPLLEQWKKRLSTFLGISAKDIGEVGGGKDRRNGSLDVAMVQSLVRDKSVVDWIASYGVVIMDECHHVPAVSIEKVLREVKARRVYGLTATPRRKDGLHRILHFQCGPIRHRVPETIASGNVEKILETRETGILPPAAEGPAGIQAQFGFLASHADRTRLIVQDVAELVTGGAHPLVLTERVEHLAALQEALSEKIPQLIVLKGGEGVKVRRALAARLAALGDQEPWAVLATGRYIGEGFDEPRLDALVLAMPISWKGTLVQYAGRIQRERSGKDLVRILDYVDDGPLLRSMAKKRQRVWRSLGFRETAK
jgi:superfamily II DNA or RNA helicase